MSASSEDTRLYRVLLAAVYVLCALYVASIVFFALGSFVGGVVLAAVASAAGFALHAWTRVPRVQRQLRRLAHPTERR